VAFTLKNNFVSSPIAGMLIYKYTTRKATISVKTERINTLFAAAFFRSSIIAFNIFSWRASCFVCEEMVERHFVTSSFSALASSSTCRSLVDFPSDFLLDLEPVGELTLGPELMLVCRRSCIMWYFDQWGKYYETEETMLSRCRSCLLWLLVLDI